VIDMWKPVPGYEGYYEVSSLGKVRSLDRISSHGRRLKGRVLAATPNDDGYPIVNLARDGAKRVRMVHVLVLEAFVGPRPEGLEGCHGNGDPQDNRVTNLRWDTHHENMLDGARHGTMGRPASPICSRGHTKTVGSTGRLGCVTCQAERSRAIHARRSQTAHGIGGGA